jgi:hypothetical protein
MWQSCCFVVAEVMLVMMAIAWDLHTDTSQARAAASNCCQPEPEEVKHAHCIQLHLQHKQTATYHSVPQTPLSC